MKFTGSKLFLLLTVCLAIAFTSCEEGLTIDVPGPDISYEFTYSKDLLNPNLRSTVTGYQLVGQSDTIKGQDVESFLSSKGEKFSSIVESATISDATMALTGEGDFTGVDSIQVRYQIAGSEDEFVLAQAGIDSISGKNIRFSTIKISKVDAFELIKSNVVAKVYAIYDQPSANCFQDGNTYKFTAKTTLSLKVAGLADSFISKTN